MLFLEVYIFINILNNIRFSILVEFCIELINKFDIKVLSKMVFNKNVKN